MSRKVIPIFKVGEVEDVLKQASEMGFKELVIVGKRMDGMYTTLMTSTENQMENLGMAALLQQVGMSVLLQHYLIEVMEENSL